MLLFRRFPYLLTGVFFLTRVAGMAQTGLSVFREMKSGDTTVSHLIKGALEGDSVFSQLTNMIQLDHLEDGILSAVRQSEGVGLLKRFDGIAGNQKSAAFSRQRTAINISYYHTTDDTLTVNSTFMNANVTTAFNVFGVPVTGQYSAVFADNVWNSKWATGGVNLDISALRASVLEKLTAAEMKKYFTANAGSATAQLSKMDYATLVSDAKFTAYNTAINHPAFIRMKYMISHTLDSLSAKADSSLGARQIIDSLQQIQRRFVAFEQKYERLWAERQAWIQEAQKLTLKLSEADSALRELEDPVKMKLKAARSGVLSWKEKALLNVKELAVGQFSANEEEFTIKNQLLTGLQFETEINHKTLGFMVGKGGYASFFAPALYNPYQQSALGKRFIHLKYGFMTPDSGKITIRLMNARRTSDTSLNTAFTSPDNTVADLSYERSLGSRFQLQTSVAYSHTGDVIGFSEDSGGQADFFSHSAGSGSLYYRLNAASKIGFGYYYIGDGFATFGNDFLVNNRHGVKADVRLGFLKNKLTFRGEYRFGRPNRPELNGLSESSLLQVSTEASWNMGKGNFIQFRYLPNTFTQTAVGTARPVDYWSNLYIATGNFSYRLAGLQQNTNLTFSNINQQAIYFDSLTSNRTSFFGWNQRARLNGKNSVDFKSQLGYALPAGVVTTGYAELDDNFAVGKGSRFSSGLQISKRSSEASWRYGLTANASFYLGKTLSASGGAVYRLKPLNGAADGKGEWIINSSVSMGF